ncbi:MAG: IS630 family transposase [Deltaproteobacteria bacterium]|nr:IS630 family transposase [Deltaproteobacteria bacterium]
MPGQTRRRSEHIKKLSRLRRREDRDLWFEDECHFHQHGSRCTVWVAPEDVDPVVLHAATRNSVAVFGAVCVANGRLVTRKTDRFSTETFLCFLQELLTHHYRGRKMVLVLDNARWHHARKLQPWLKEHRQYLRLDFLPPYSPELNPMERVWKLTRRLRTHNQYFPLLDELVTTVGI